jgi:hypothetical protein
VQLADVRQQTLKRTRQKLDALHAGESIEANLAAFRRIGWDGRRWDYFVVFSARA